MKQAPKRQLSDAELKAFVAAWTKADNVAAVVTATGLRESQCASNAARLRKLGVKLKKMRRGPTVDVAELNKIIDTTMQVMRNQSGNARAAEAIAARRKG